MRIGVAALSGPCTSEALDRGLEEMRRLGLEPVLSRNLASGEGGTCAVDDSGLFAGSDAERLSGFHDLLKHGGVEGVVFARGGHGLLRLLPRLDWKLLGRATRHGVRLCGYSDLTPLLNEVVRRTGGVALHGPMVASELSEGLTDVESESLLRGLAGADAASHPLARLTEPGGSGTPRVRQGILRGGCLSLLAATLGTPYQVPFRGSIMFCEDVGEPLYRRDRLLTQLMLSHSLTSVNALVLGHFSGSPEVAEESWRTVVSRQGETARVPVFAGLCAGHARPNLTLPLGATARLAADGQLEIAGGLRGASS